MAARAPAAAGRMSLRAFGRRRSVSLTAVQKAIRSGRLRKSVGRDARGPFISDPVAADLEWASGATKPANGGNGGGRRHHPARASLPAARPAPRAAADPGGPTLVGAQLRLADQRADALELANRRKRGELLDAGEVERDQFQAARTLRDRILNVPDRLDLDHAVRARLRAELRQALGEVADELERE